MSNRTPTMDNSDKIKAALHNNMGAGDASDFVEKISSFRHDCPDGIMTEDAYPQFLQILADELDILGFEAPLNG